MVLKICGLQLSKQILRQASHIARSSLPNYGNQRSENFYLDEKYEQSSCCQYQYQTILSNSDKASITQTSHASFPSSSILLGIQLQKSVEMGESINMTRKNTMTLTD